MKSIFRFIPLNAFLFLLFCTQTDMTSASIPQRGYTGKRFPQQGSDISSQFIQHNNIGMPLKGFVVGNDGNVTEHIIVYQEPEKLLAHEFDLAICREANGKKADILNPQNEPNFASWVKKDQLSAFYVGEQLFVKNSKNKWYILMSEGAIREIVAITKVVNNGQTGYAITEMIQKLDEEPVSVTGLALGFKNTMSSMTSDHTALSGKIKNKEKGYRLLNISSILKEYNSWFNLQYPGKVNYVMPYTYSVPAATTEELGNLLHKAFSEKNYDIIAGLTPYHNDFLATVREKVTDPDMLRQAEKELQPGVNKIVAEKNKEAFFTILSDFGNTDASLIKFDRFNFIRNDNRSSQQNIEQGRGELHLWVNNNPYQINFKKMFLLKNGWKISEISKVTIEIIIHTPDPDTTHAVTVVEAEPARYDLPDKYMELPGEWTFVKALLNGKDVSKEIRQYYIHDQAITIKFLFGGKIVYPVQAETELKITHGYWSYNPNEERDLEIITYMTDGSATQRFKIVSVTPNEFVYTDPKSKTTYYFKR